MPDRSFLSWPFFEPKHRELAARLEEWCDEWIHDAEASDPDAACRLTPTTTDSPASIFC